MKGKKQWILNIKKNINIKIFVQNLNLLSLRKNVNIVLVCNLFRNIGFWYMKSLKFQRRIEMKHLQFCITDEQFLRDMKIKIKDLQIFLSFTKSFSFIFLSFTLNFKNHISFILPAAVKIVIAINMVRHMQIL